MINYDKVEKEFIKSLKRKNLSEARINRYKHTFKEMKNLNIQQINKKEIDKFYFYLINNKKWKEWTKLTKWKCFKKICKFIKKDIDFSEWYIKEPKTEPEILSQEEIAKLIYSANNLRDKLIIFLLYESGMRIGELLNLRKQDVYFDENGAILKVNGKTGLRYVRVVKCSDLLQQYVKYLHSEKLFELTKRNIAIMLKNCAKKVGIKKRIYPHLFRHTRATHLAKFLTEPELKIYFGWSPKSRMAEVYVHLSSRDVENKIIQLSKNYEFIRE